MIIKLQTTVGHQEEEIKNLSCELYIQQKELTALKAQMAALMERLKSLSASNDTGIDITNEPPPPHY